MKYAELEKRCADANVSVGDVACLCGFAAYYYSVISNEPRRADGTVVDVNPRELDVVEEPLLVMYEAITEMFELAGGVSWDHVPDGIHRMAQEKWDTFKVIVQQSGMV